MENTLVDLRNFFSTPERPCLMPEFKEFWLSLTDADKQYYKTAELKMAADR